MGEATTSTFKISRSQRITGGDDLRPDPVIDGNASFAIFCRASRDAFAREPKGIVHDGCSKILDHSPDGVRDWIRAEAMSEIEGDEDLTDAVVGRLTRAHDALGSFERALVTDFGDPRSKA